MLLLGGVCTKSVACSVMLMALLLVAGAQETAGGLACAARLRILTVLTRTDILCVSAAPMMPSGNKTIYVLPKGGLGNQLRFLGEGSVSDLSDLSDLQNPFVCPQ